jgi:hypothetical protein
MQRTQCAFGSLSLHEIGSFVVICIYFCVLFVIKYSFRSLFDDSYESRVKKMAWENPGKS